jgi:hypothetical protein
VFDSSKSFSITTGVADVFQDATAPGTAAAGTYGATIQSVDKMDISTYDASIRTLAIVDSALSAISSQPRFLRRPADPVREHDHQPADHLGEPLGRALAHP